MPLTRARAAEADLVLLHAMLNRATTVRHTDRKGWLDANPLKGIERRREKNPRRPVRSQDRYLATRRATADPSAQQIDDARSTRVAKYVRFASGKRERIARGPRRQTATSTSGPGIRPPGAPAP